MLSQSKELLFSTTLWRTPTVSLYTIRVAAPLKPHYSPVFRGKRLFLGGDKNGEKKPKK